MYENLDSPDNSKTSQNDEQGIWIELIRKTPLFLITIGIIIAIIATSNNSSVILFGKIPLDLKIIPLGRALLIMLAILCFGVGLWTVFNNEQDRRTGIIAQKNKRISCLEEELKETKNYQSKYEKLVEQLNQIANEYQEDSFSSEFNKLLKSLETIKHEIGVDSEQRDNAATWIEANIARWVDQIILDDFRGYGITQNNFNEFKEDVAAHLRLLCSNIRNDINGFPSLQKPSIQRLKPTFIYQRALEQIFQYMGINIRQDKLPNGVARLIEEKMTALIKISVC